MARTSGLGDNLYVAGYDLSGDIGELGNIHGGPAPLEVTGIDKSAIERIGGLRDGSIEFQSWFDHDSVNGLGAHDVFSTLPTTDVIVTYCRGTTLGDPAACCVGKQLNYDLKRAADGALTADVAVQANGYGIEWGTQYTFGKRTDTTAANGTSIDYGASSAFGLQAYLQVFSFAGTSCTVKLQDSADDVTFADVTGGTFTAATGRTAERIATATNLSVGRYLRVATTGTFTSCVFSVVVVRNDVATSF